MLFTWLFHLHYYCGISRVANFGSVLSPTVWLDQVSLKPDIQGVFMSEYQKPLALKWLQETDHQEKEPSAISPKLRQTRTRDPIYPATLVKDMLTVCYVGRIFFRNTLWALKVNRLR
jgi:hypothetical protein